MKPAGTPRRRKANPLHQRRVDAAVENAREMALLPYASAPTRGG